MLALGFLLAVLSFSILFSATSAEGISFTGFFKAFDKTMYPGNSYERNITVRKYYNTSVRFVKENGSSYLTFTDDDTLIILKDFHGNDIISMEGIESGKSYHVMNNSILSSIVTVSVYGMDEYEDVIDQSPEVTSIGAKAFITVTVNERPQIVHLYGYVIDDLTGETVDGSEILMFDNDADPESAVPVAVNYTEDGRYDFTLEADDSKPVDVYVRDYYVVE